MTRSVLTGSQDTWPGVRQQTLAANWEALGAQRADASPEERSTPAPQGSGQAQPELSRVHPDSLCGLLPTARRLFLLLELSAPQESRISLEPRSAIQLPCSRPNCSSSLPLAVHQSPLLLCPISLQVLGPISSLRQLRVI